MSLSFNDQILKQAKLARAFFKRRYGVNYNEQDEEDFESFCLEEFLRNGTQKLRFDYLITDYLRKVGGYTKKYTGPDLMSRGHRRGAGKMFDGTYIEDELQHILRSEQNDPFIQQSTMVSERLHMESEADFGKHFTRKEAKLRTLTILMYKYNFRIGEYADAMGMCNKTATQLHKTALQILEKRIGKAKDARPGQPGKTVDETKGIHEQEQRKNSETKKGEIQSFRVSSF